MTDEISKNIQSNDKNLRVRQNSNNFQLNIKLNIFLVL
jgi:hypothetical protein